MISNCTTLRLMMFFRLIYIYIYIYVVVLLVCSACSQLRNNKIVNVYIRPHSFLVPDATSGPSSRIRIRETKDDRKYSPQTEHRRESRMATRADNSTSLSGLSTIHTHDTSVEIKEIKGTRAQLKSNVTRLISKIDALVKNTGSRTQIRELV